MVGSLHWRGQLSPQAASSGDTGVDALPETGGTRSSVDAAARCSGKLGCWFTSDPQGRATDHGSGEGYARWYSPFVPLKPIMRVGVRRGFGLVLVELEMGWCNNPREQMTHYSISWGC